MFKTIEKIKNNELSFQECLNLLKGEKCWKFFERGSLCIFILKRLIQFLPERYEGQKITKRFGDLMTDIDSTILKILNELNVGEEVEEEEEQEEQEGGDDELFKLFYRSPTYRNLYNNVNILFKNLNLYEELYLTESEYRNLKKKVKDKRILEIKLSHAKLHKKLKIIEKEKLIKSLRSDKDLLNERLQIKKEKMIDKKLDNQIGEFIFYARLLRLFYCSIFKTPFTDKNVQQIIPIHFQDDMKNTRLYNLFDKCKKIYNFSLRLQVFLVKNIMDDSHIYKKRYMERKNFLNETVYEIDYKYPHLLWPIIEKMKPKLYERILDIHSEEFAQFLEEKKNQMKLLFVNKSTNRWMDDLILLFYIKSWFEDILGITDWSSNYTHLNVFKKRELELKEMNGFYPIIVNLFYTCWGVLFEDTVYFGKLVHVLFKYKEILREKFDLKLPKLGGLMKKVCIKKFLVFPLK